MAVVNVNFVRALVDEDANFLDTLLKIGERNFDINEMLKNKMPALQFAVLFRRIDIVKVLLKHGANVNQTNKYGETCLHLALGDSITEDKIKHIQILLEDVVVNSVCKKKMEAPFSKEKKNLKNFRKLFKGKPATSLNFWDYTSVDYDNSRGDDTSLIELLLKSGADPNIQCNSKDTPFLMYCYCRQKDTTILDLFLKCGANLKIENSEGANALETAIEFGSVEMVKKLLDAGADMNDMSDFRVPLTIATYNEDDKETASIMKLLVDNGARVNDLDGLGSPLQTAVRYGKLEQVKYLLSLGADPNLYDPSSGMETSNESPLWFAARNGYPKIAEYLINHGANVFYIDCDGTTLLNAAMYENDYIANFKSLNCAMLLMERGVTIGENDYKNVTSENIQILKDCEQELKVLKEIRIHQDFSTTYLEFLVKRNQALVRCLRNEKIAEMLKSEDYKEKFVYFAKRLEENYDRGLEQKLLNDKLRTVLTDTFQTVFPTEIIFAICDFFNLEDLRKCFVNDEK